MQHPYKHHLFLVIYSNMDIHTDVTKDLKEREINKMKGHLSDTVIFTPNTPIFTPFLP